MSSGLRKKEGPRLVVDMVRPLFVISQALIPNPAFFGSDRSPKAHKLWAPYCMFLGQDIIPRAYSKKLLKGLL